MCWCVCVSVSVSVFVCVCLCVCLCLSLCLKCCLAFSIFERNLLSSSHIPHTVYIHRPSQRPLCYYPSSTGRRVPTVTVHYCRLLLLLRRSLNGVPVSSFTWTQLLSRNIPEYALFLRDVSIMLWGKGKRNILYIIYLQQQMHICVLNCIKKVTQKYRNV